MVAHRMGAAAVVITILLGCGDDGDQPGGGGQGAGGASSSASTSTSQGSTTSSNGSTTTGQGGAGGAGGGELCADREGGALIDFDIVGELLRVWTTDDAFIDEAISQLGGMTPPRVAVFVPAAGVDCDAQWSWHTEPTPVSFADLTIELCDGRPSDVEGDIDYWVNTVGQYCPWSAVVSAVDDRR